MLETRENGRAELKTAIDQFKKLKIDLTDRKCLDKIGVLATKMENHLLQAKDSTTTIPKLEKYIDNFIPLGDRTVLEQRERELLHDGYTIIIEGEETGKFWDKEEYDKGMKNDIKFTKKTA